MKIFLQAAVVTGALLVGAMPAAAQSADNRVECFPFTAASVQGTRVPCPFFFFNFGTTRTFSYQVTTTVPKKKWGYHRYGRYGNRGSRTVTRTESGNKRGGPSALASYAIGSTWCSAASLIFAAAVTNATQNRELRSSEAFEIVGGCWVPIVGSLFWRSMFAANPQWDQNIQAWYGRRS